MSLSPCVPPHCGACGEDLSGLDPEPERHQQVDIPEPQVIVTEFQMRNPGDAVRRFRGMSSTDSGAWRPAIPGSRRPVWWARSERVDGMRRNLTTGEAG